MQIFAIAALALSANHSVVLPWDIGGHREDRVYPLRLLLQYFRFPKQILLVPATVYPALTAHLQEIEFDDSVLISQDCFYELMNTKIALQVMRLPGQDVVAAETVPAPLFLASYRQLGNTWLPAQSVMPVQLPWRYLVLHVRLGDKARQDGGGGWRTESQHQALIAQTADYWATVGRYCTHEVLRAAVQRGWQVILVSDSPDVVEKITHDYPTVTDAFQHYPASVRAANATKLQREAADVAIMMRARGIVQHSPLGWSSFSSSVALIKQVPILSTWVEENMDCIVKRGPLFWAYYQLVTSIFPKLKQPIRCDHLWPRDWSCVNKQVSFALRGGKPAELLMCRRSHVYEDIAAFLDLID